MQLNFPSAVVFQKKKVRFSAFSGSNNLLDTRKYFIKLEMGMCGLCDAYQNSHFQVQHLPSWNHHAVRHISIRTDMTSAKYVFHFGIQRGFPRGYWIYRCNTVLFFDRLFGCFFDLFPYLNKCRS